MKPPAPPEVVRLAPSRIPELAAFTKSAGELAEWKERYPEAAAALAAIADRYNPTRDAAAKTVRSRLVSSGDFELYQFRRTDDAKALMRAVGRQKFASMGGVLEPVEKLTIDREKFDALIAQDKIAEELVAEVVSFGPCFHEPAALSLP